MRFGPTFLASLAPVVALADVSGTARVIDGDTIEVAGARVRLFGIDAPEQDQPCRVDEVAYHCGIRAAVALLTLVRDHTVCCEERDRDRHDRIVAVC
jgi:endonuclease YncB( thermonuclease family)